MYSQAHTLVLVVDDEPIILSLLCRTLVEAGYQVETATSGKRALEIAGTRKFDFMVTDCLMPGMNGLDLVNAFLRIHPQARVIFMTGHLSPEIAAALEGEEVIGWLQKPFIPVKLQEMLDQAQGGGENGEE
jgi:DNA-binding NtrC family response regulator